LLAKPSCRAIARRPFELRPCAPKPTLRIFFLQPAEIGVFVGVNARAAKFLLANTFGVSYLLAQNGVCCRKHQLILIISQPSEDMTNPAE
jgi:hypothetical protein